MDHACGDDGSRIGGAGNGLSANEGFKVERLRGRARDAESLLKLLPVGSVGEKEPCGFGALLLQSLEDKNTAAAIGRRQQRDGGVVFARTSREGQTVVGILLLAFRMH